jgi:hypothetical protein
MGYGITGIIPIGKDGRIQNEAMEQWIQRRREIESALPIEGKKVVPQPEDVLLGRGKKVQAFPGNLKFRGKIEANRRTYDNSSKFEKSVLIEAILRSVKDSGGRFLQQGTKGYFEVDDDVARKKISHAWRNLRASRNRTVSPIFISRNLLPFKQEFLVMSIPFEHSSPKVTEFYEISSGK